MPNDFPSREMAPMVSLFQRAHNKIVSLQRLDDQIAALVAQHERLQEEVRGVQAEINEEFEKALRYNQAPEKLPAGLVSAARERALINTDSSAAAMPSASNGEDHDLVLLPARA